MDPNTADETSINVVMFCPQFRPRVGGAERQAEKLAAALAEIGCCVKIVTPRFDPDSPDQEKANGVVIDRIPLADLSVRYRIPGISFLNIPYITWQIFRTLSPKLRDADVLHCHIASLLTVSAAFTGRILGIPVLCKAAMADKRSDLGEIERSGLTGHFISWLGRQLIQRWVATTHAVEQALVRAGVPAARIVQIPNGVELDPSRTSRPLTAPPVRRFLYLGRLSTNIQRDVPTLIAAFAEICHTHPDTELAIVGGGDLLESTRRLAANSPVSDRIHMPGFSEAERWLAWAHCFLLPSRREGLSNALLEAMAAGLPCIANDIPPNREVLADGEAGILVPVGDITALANAMSRIMEEPDSALHFSQRGYERAMNQYSIQAIAYRYRDIYSEFPRTARPHTL